jgi:hypothetical protein
LPPHQKFVGSNRIGPSAPAELAPLWTPGRLDWPLSDSTAPMAARPVHGSPRQVTTACSWSERRGFYEQAESGRRGGESRAGRAIWAVLHIGVAGFEARKEMPANLPEEFDQQFRGELCIGSVEL